MIVHLLQKIFGDIITRFRSDDGINATLRTKCGRAHFFFPVTPAHNFRWGKDVQTVKAAAKLAAENLLAMLDRMSVCFDRVFHMHGTAIGRACRIAHAHYSERRVASENGRSKSGDGNVFGASPVKPYTSSPPRTPLCSKAKMPLKSASLPKIKSAIGCSPPDGGGKPSTEKWMLAQPQEQRQSVTVTFSNCVRKSRPSGPPCSSIQRIRCSSPAVSERFMGLA